MIENQNWNDAKSLLQQCCLELREQGSGKDPDLPVYKYKAVVTHPSPTHPDAPHNGHFNFRVIGKSGPTHRRLFKVAVYFKDKRLAYGEGLSIQKAQFEAAQNALEENKGERVIGRSRSMGSAF